ncbi:MAG TPA: TIGR00159 family protein [Verrucomicrobiales bacterium]|nr:TIGR00159 family protein [Verrucomicrobiales bacterium]HIL68958.1 TIGR00159 family protein [Verrucomicrobiota bacterium]
MFQALLKILWHPIFEQNIWVPVMEILFISTVIYFLALFLRGTRGASVVLGFGVIFIFLRLSTNYFEFSVLNHLLSAFSVPLVFAACVIFQPELRRILAGLGNQTLTGSSYEQRENIEVIVQSAENLAEVNIGALMAIEQNQPLQGVVESGIEVDCQATPEMIETIFFPNNVVHDGGIVIKGDRIAYAACIFPLTQRQDLNTSVGTRHRAALGLSEESDSVVVVVSEETGAISYTYKGYLVRNVSPEELRSFLTSVFVKQKKPKKFVDRLKPGTVLNETSETQIITKGEKNQKDQ